MKWWFLCILAGVASGCSGGCGEATPEGPTASSKSALKAGSAKETGGKASKKGAQAPQAAGGDGKAKLDAPAPAPIKHEFPPPEGFVYQKPPELKFGSKENAVMFEAPADHETCEGEGCEAGPEFSGTVTLYKHPRIEAATRTPRTPEVEKYWADNQPDVAERVRKEMLEAAPEGAPKKPLTVEGLEADILACNVCKMLDRGPDRDCQAWQSLEDVRRNRRKEIRALGAPVADVFRRHVKHAHPVVRLVSSQLLSSFFGNTKANQDLLLEVAKKEDVPQVYRVLLRGFRPAVARSPEVLALLLEAADSADERTRAVAVGGLAARGAKGVEGALERVLVAIEKDPSALNRQLACRQIGHQADDRALPMFEKNTRKPSGDDDSFYNGCFVGLVSMWSTPVAHDTPSKKAYALTMKRLQAKPRTAKQVPWVAISNLVWAGKPGFAEKAPWFDKPALIGALADIAKDRKVDWVTRATVAKTLTRLGAEKATFEEIRVTYLDASYKPGPHFNVYRELMKQMAKADKKVAKGDGTPPAPETPKTKSAMPKSQAR